MVENESKPTYRFGVPLLEPPLVKVREVKEPESDKEKLKPKIAEKGRRLAYKHGSSKVAGSKVTTLSERVKRIEERLGLA